ncbi:hypothetical protein IAQ61_003200 [Plenodomus lingam]|uniref:Predicted protein n=1 Tax=Leptosphaeria maculans (strain JN3 / isolate v23.1.3 / race Av1-4-5-6-7-8) TaxID=985895 RepID=E5ADT0_LEPMJ|nr:predicted protein [Plenodomus lingam JN3]KAH9875736.1 hypothetical protein IAQ61_003200 [Plenodomus lingam]CBY01369.1 predicted protein [Plenodomus lingam JN3]
MTAGMGTFGGSVLEQLSDGESASSPKADRCRQAFRPHRVKAASRAVCSGRNQDAHWPQCIISDADSRVVVR